MCLDHRGEFPGLLLCPQEKVFTALVTATHSPFIDHYSLISVSHSYQGISLCPCHCLCWSGFCSDQILRRGLSHHLRLWHSPQRLPRGRLEMGRLQRGRGVWEHGVSGVCWCPGEQTRCSVSHEQAQQRSWKDRKDIYYFHFLDLLYWFLTCHIRNLQRTSRGNWGNNHT